MKYKVRIEKKVVRELKRIPRGMLKRISEKLLVLEENPRPFGIKKLTGVEGYRLVMGDYRILFTIDDRSKEVNIYRLKHRKEVYRRR